VADNSRRIKIYLYLHDKMTHFSDATPMENKETPFQTTLQLDDVTYSLRHVEESWIHLLKAGMRVIYCEKGKIPFTYFSIIAVFSSLWGEHVCKNVYFVCMCTPHTHFFNDVTGSFETMVPIKHITWHNNLEYRKLLLQYIENI
jgi:hypothetical protein